MQIKLMLDINKSEGRFSSLEEAIELRQTDAVAYTILCEIREDGAVLDLTGCTVRFYAIRPDGATVIEQAQITSAADGVVFYTIPKEFTEVTGNVQNAYFRITSNGGYSASTESIAFKIKPSAFIEASGGDYAPEIDQVIDGLEEQRIEYTTREEQRSGEWLNLKADTSDAIISANSAASSVTYATSLAEQVSKVALEALREATAERTYSQTMDTMARLLTVDYLVLGDSIYAAGSIIDIDGTTATLSGAEIDGDTLVIPETQVQNYLANLTKQSDYEHAQRETANAAEIERNRAAIEADETTIASLRSWVANDYAQTIGAIIAQLPGSYLVAHEALYAASSVATIDGTTAIIAVASISDMTLVLG